MKKLLAYESLSRRISFVSNYYDRNCLFLLLLCVCAKVLYRFNDHNLPFVCEINTRAHSFNCLHWVVHVGMQSAVGFQKEKRHIYALVQQLILL